MSTNCYLRDILAIFTAHAQKLFSDSFYQQNYDIAVRFGDPDFLKESNRLIRRLQILYFYTVFKKTGLLKLFVITSRKQLFIEKRWYK